ncbi:uncharacterized protein VDAG_07111 [Verticillium dahliae VdLs.17]|uniref:Uncharacterized protein n=1 Tax=Verticillium dahliae (strain VdLs.17 / ATCC MYA-4575 / FGSC 10137) TaxID=498257 RepID=G2X9R6_VERDV|nr:uncharacterized protein VDAG_07111 [Verticillium dahliae VdLs.17]EGY15947.1 hypothetical protein VDAG_07111 [Verticillium dahliae VdLs.17]KAH6683822.1 hypothetical protein EV126DRAFT_351078 [Verticillium dahliae]PNH49627.1 hypothetical protein VD0003_g7528 [Verticillium dahliae]
MDALASSIIYPKATKFRADSKSAKVAKKAKKPKAPKEKKETSRKRVTLKKKVPEEGPKVCLPLPPRPRESRMNLNPTNQFENPNAGTVVYELAKNALGPPSPPHDEDIPLEDLLPPDEVRIRAPHDAAVSVLDTPLVNASVSKGVFTLRVKKGKVGGAGHNEFLERLVRTTTEGEFHAALSDSVQGAARVCKADRDAAKAAPRLARQKRRVERAKRALERLAELNMEQSELWIKREEEEYEGGDEDEVQSCEDSETGQELEVVE